MARSVKVNIGHDGDIFWNYKRSMLIVEHTAPGFRGETLLVNLEEIARQLRRPVAELAHFIEMELQAPVTLRNDEQYVAKGARTVATLEAIINRYVELCILCPRCGIPEASWIVSVKDSQKTLNWKCEACGHVGAVSSFDFSTYILNGGPQTRSAKKKPKDAATASSTPARTSATAAVATALASVAEPVSRAEFVEIMCDEFFNEWRRDSSERKLFGELGKLRSRDGVTNKEIIIVISETILRDGLLHQGRVSPLATSLLLPYLIDEPKAQRALLRWLEYFFASVSPESIRHASRALKYLHESGALTIAVIEEWYSSDSCVPGDEAGSRRVRNVCFNLVTGLQQQQYVLAGKTLEPAWHPCRRGADYRPEADGDSSSS